jgi:hypothetical protein
MAINICALLQSFATRPITPLSDQSAAIICVRVRLVIAWGAPHNNLIFASVIRKKASVAIYKKTSVSVFADLKTPNKL